MTRDRLYVIALFGQCFHVEKTIEGKIKIIFKEVSRLCTFFRKISHPIPPRYACRPPQIEKKKPTYQLPSEY